MISRELIVISPARAGRYSYSYSYSGNLRADYEHEYVAEALEDSVAVEVFSPVRADYLPQSQDE